MGLIIEMLGAPGAGKTTLVPVVEQVCRDRGFTPFTVESAARPFAARTVLGRVVAKALPSDSRRKAMWVVFRLASGWHSLRFALSHPRLSRYVLRSQRGRPADADARQRRVLYWYLRTMGSYGFALAHRRENEAVIVDEGFAHRAVQLFSSSVELPDADLIAGYVARLPRPDAVVHVAASFGVCRRRVEARGVWERLSHRDASEVNLLLQNAHHTVRLTREALASAGWNIIEVNNDDDGFDHADVVVQLAGSAFAQPAGARNG